MSIRTYSIIVAVSENHVIGMQGEMPWKKMSGDLKYFKEKTTGNWCILGRKTYNALGNKILPGRKFIIITRDPDFVAEDSLVVHHINDAINHPVLADENEVFVLGGGDIYKQSMEFVDRIYLTKIHATFEGDTFFPELGDAWKLVVSEAHKMDQKNPYDYDFLVYERK